MEKRKDKESRSQYEAAASKADLRGVTDQPRTWTFEVYSQFLIDLMPSRP